MICKPKNLFFGNYFDLPVLSTVVHVIVAVAVDSDTSIVTVRRRLCLCVVVVYRIPTVSAAIAINPIGYAVEVDTVLLCDSVSVGGIVCLYEYQRSSSESAA